MRDATTQGVTFDSLLDRPIHARFDQPAASSDGGALLLKAVDERLGLSAALAQCLRDERDPTRTLHSMLDLLRQRIIGKVRDAFPGTVLRVRLDGGFATSEILDFLDESGVEYVVAISGNSVLRDHAEQLMPAVRARSAESGVTEHDYDECEYAAESWNDFRRVIIKAEVVRLGERAARDNPRLVVTNLRQTPRWVYESVYCERGAVENRIKELLYGLDIDRTSCHRFFANQFRALMTAAAYVLYQQLRHAARGTSLASAQVGTLRERLIKLGVWIERSTRRIVLHLPDSAPWRSDWCRIARRLGAVPI